MKFRRRNTEALADLICGDLRSQHPGRDERLPAAWASFDCPASSAQRPDLSRLREPDIWMRAAALLRVYAVSGTGFGGEAGAELNDFFGVVAAVAAWSPDGRQLSLPRPPGHRLGANPEHSRYLRGSQQPTASDLLTFSHADLPPHLSLPPVTLAGFHIVCHKSTNCPGGMQPLGPRLTGIAASGDRLDSSCGCRPDAACGRRRR